MSTSEILTIIALIVGPILAVTAQRSVDLLRDKRNRKLWIFKTLMATRGSVLNSAHVEALNRIDLEFSGNKKYVEVLNKWQLYFNQLSIKPGKNELLVWKDKADDLLADLLLEMGTQLGYKFNLALIKRNVYYPEGHGKNERETQEIREETLKLMKGEISLPVTVYNTEATVGILDEQKALWDLMSKWYKRELGEDSQKKIE